MGSFFQTASCSWWSNAAVCVKWSPKIPLRGDIWWRLMTLYVVFKPWQQKISRACIEVEMFRKLEKLPYFWGVSSFCLNPSHHWNQSIRWFHWLPCQVEWYTEFGKNVQPYNPLPNLWIELYLELQANDVSKCHSTPPTHPKVGDFWVALHRPRSARLMGSLHVCGNDESGLLRKASRMI